MQNIDVTDRDGNTIASVSIDDSANPEQVRREIRSIWERNTRRAAMRTGLGLQLRDHFPHRDAQNNIVCRCDEVLLTINDWARHVAAAVLPESGG